MTLRSLALAGLVLLLACAVLPLTASATTGPLLAAIAGPTALAPSQTAAFNVTISGGPSGHVNYSVSYYLSGGNLTGANPLKASPGQVTGNRTLVRVNVTAPSAEGTVTLTVNVVATPSIGVSETTSSSVDITIIRGIVLTATFHNGGTTTALNVTVIWAIDGTTVGTSLLKQLGANADATVTFTYLPAGLSPGRHTLTVSADLDHNGVIDPARGEVVTSTIFYSQVEQPAMGWAILLGIGVFIPVFLGVAAARRRGEP